MNWYLAKIIFNININNGMNASQFDEQLRLIEAQTPDEAFFKARALGKQEEESFINEKKNTVDWKFIDVAELTQLNELKDGSEIYSNTHEADEVNAYIKFVKHKAMLIQSNHLIFA